MTYLVLAYREAVKTTKAGAIAAKSAKAETGGGTGPISLYNKRLDGEDA
jgi:hypothetical protein